MRQMATITLIAAAMTLVAFVGATEAQPDDEFKSTSFSAEEKKWQDQIMAAEADQAQEPVGELPPSMDLVAPSPKKKGSKSKKMQKKQKEQKVKKHTHKAVHKHKAVKKTKKSKTPTSIAAQVASKAAWGRRRHYFRRIPSSRRRRTYRRRRSFRRRRSHIRRRLHIARRRRHRRARRPSRATVSRLPRAHYANLWAKRRLARLRAFYRKTVATEAALQAKALRRANDTRIAANQAAAKAKESAFKLKRTQKRVRDAWSSTVKRFLAARRFEAKAASVVRRWLSRRRFAPFRKAAQWAKVRLVKLKMVYRRAVAKAARQARARRREAISARKVALKFAAMAKAAVIKYNRTKRGVHKAWIGTVKRFISARRFEANAAKTTARFTRTRRI